MAARRFLPIGGADSGFWNLRDSLKMLLGAIDIGTHMSLVKLSTGKFVAIDTCKLPAEAKAQLDQLTNNGELLEAVIATHPYHTLYFEPFHKLYPNAQYYGTPRHLRNIKSIPWAGDVSTPEVLSKWESEGLYLRIPAGAEFVNAVSHFSGLFVYHKPSKTLFNDDTLMCWDRPGFVLRLVGAADGKMSFHPDTLTSGLFPTEEAPKQFSDFVQSIINEWDIENIVTAHNGNKIGDAKAALQNTLDQYQPKFTKLSQECAKKAKK